MNAFIAILVIAYFGACIFAGIKFGTSLGSVVFGFLFFCASIVLTPILTLAAYNLKG